jgi:hypothetical protein
MLIDIMSSTSIKEGLKSFLMLFKDFGFGWISGFSPILNVLICNDLTGLLLPLQGFSPDFASIRQGHNLLRPALCLTCAGTDTD